MYQVEHTSTWLLQKTHLKTLTQNNRRKHGTFRTT
jgi:hypothetical protein